MLGRISLGIELMFVRNLGKLFPLRLVARIGGSDRFGSAGAVVPSRMPDAGLLLAEGLSQSFTATKENGMLLGLSISQRFAQQMVLIQQARQYGTHFRRRMMVVAHRLL